MHRILTRIAVLAALAIAGCGAPTPNHKAPTEINWRNGDVQDAFEEAAQSGRPILLYWGAVWCPPCNRLKAVLFHDPSFIALTEDFVPVYLDGDSRGAQRWGEVFAISGYPTLIVLRPDHQEITRLSGGGSADEIVRTLRAVRASQATATGLLARAQQTPQSLSSDDWTLLANYGWEVDAGKLVPVADRSSVLRRLAAAAPDGPVKRRLALVALTAELGAQSSALNASAPDDVRALLNTVLASPTEVRQNRSSLSDHGAALIERAGVNPSERAPLSDALIAALDGVYADTSLPIDDRLGAINAEIELVSAGNAPNITATTLLAKVRERVAWADSAAQTPYERQSVISDAAELLKKAGDAAGAERLLTAELGKSATPFYYMPDLADLAEARGDTGAALNWLRRGYETSTGAATRVQWATIYAQGVIRLRPGDQANVESVVNLAIAELGSQPNSYHQRSRARLEKLATALTAWSSAHEGDDVLQRLHARMSSVCVRTQHEADARAGCTAWLANAA